MADVAGPACVLSGSHCRQALGIVGAATWTNMCGCGVEGLRLRGIPAWSGRESPLRRLHGAHDATMFSHDESPPLDRGITWSTVSVDVEPQY